MVDSDAIGAPSAQAARAGEASLAALTVLVPAGESAGSQAQQAYYRIRDQLVTLELPPGARLEERALMQQLDLGRTPVREAIRQLAAEGLITVYPRRGTVVSPVDARDLASVSQVRVELEGLAARLAAQRADADDQRRAAELLAQIDGGKIAPPTGDSGPTEVHASAVRALIRLDQRVHHCVHGATHNPYLRSTLTEYLTHSLRLWFLGLDRVHRLDEAVTEHRDVLTAILDGDAERAEQAARDHVTGFWQQMRSVLAA